MNPSSGQQIGQLLFGPPREDLAQNMKPKKVGPGKKGGGALLEPERAFKVRNPLSIQFLPLCSVLQFSHLTSSSSLSVWR